MAYSPEVFETKDKTKSITTFVLDTSVIIEDPDIFTSRGTCALKLPLVVIEELDTLKKSSSGEIAKNIRTFFRALLCLAEEQKDSVGVFDLSAGGTLEIVQLHDDIHVSNLIPPDFDTRKADNKILQTLIALRDSRRELNGHGDYGLMTNDIPLFLKARALAIPVASHHNLSLNAGGYKGLREVVVSDKDIDALYTKDQTLVLECQEELVPNEVVRLVTPKHSGQTGLAIYQKGNLEPLQFIEEELRLSNSVFPRTLEQKIAVRLLLDPSIPFVTVSGDAGTGKTLLALGSALACWDKKQYSKIVVARPIVSMGKEIGYLPGGIQEKLEPWMQPIFDNLESLVAGDKAGKKFGIPSHETMIEQNILELQALPYIRGRNISGQFFIVDEAQNADVNELKTIITRMGEGSKIVLTGDLDQIDTKGLTSTNCGLARYIEHFKQFEIGAHITLSKVERSEVAKAACLLRP